MLSYLHAYHAGNYADIQKHLALYLCLELLQRKSSALTLFDTHAGRARYDLRSDEARRTAEADTGVMALWQEREKLKTQPWPGFWQTVETLNTRTSGHLRYYPGSPGWFAALRRPQDALLTFELHPAEQEALDGWGREHGATVLREDGFKGLIRLLPPRTPRLMVLIDPPYEVKTDYRRLVDTLETAWKRCRHGVYLIWYPILEAAYHREMLAQLRKTSLRKVLHSQLLLEQRSESQRMLGSGLLLVNPPWTFDDAFQQAMGQALDVWPLPARHVMDWLIPE